MSFPAISLLALVLASSAPSQTVVRDLVYCDLATAPFNRLDVYLPISAAPKQGYPVVVGVHGGGWVAGTKEETGRRLQPLTQHGFVVVVPNYLLANAQKPAWPIDAEMIRESVRWVRSQKLVAGVRINPDRIAILGESAGGQLAEFVGSSPDAPISGVLPWSQGTLGRSGVSAEVNAVVSFFGIPDMISITANPYLANDLEILFGIDLHRGEAVYREASPIRIIQPTTPPTLLIHGSSDEVIPVIESKRYYQALRSHKIACELVIIPKGTHGMLANRKPMINPQTLDRVANFLSTVP
jgi:acetyl esterase/lipase